MFESKDILAVNDERDEMKRHLEAKYSGPFLLIDIVADITIEIKRIQERLGKLEAKKPSR